MAEPGARVRRRGRARPEVAARAGARAATSSATRSMWSNDHPMASGLETAAVFHEAAPALDVGVAVLALDRHEPDAIAAKIDERGPRPRSPVARDRRGVHEAAAGRRARGPRGAARRRCRRPRGSRSPRWGPKMCALAGAEADGVFLNWMTPERAAWARERVHEGAREAGRDEPPPDLRLRAGRGRRRRRGAAAEGGVLLPPAPPGLHPPLRVARRRSRERSASRPGIRPRSRAGLAAYEERSTTSWSARSPRGRRVALGDGRCSRARPSPTRALELFSGTADLLRRAARAQECVARALERGLELVRASGGAPQDWQRSLTGSTPSRSSRSMAASLACRPASRQGPCRELRIAP